MVVVSCAWIHLLETSVLTDVGYQWSEKGKRGHALPQTPWRRRPTPCFSCTVRPTEPRCCQTDGCMWSTSLSKAPSGQRCQTVFGDHSCNQSRHKQHFQALKNHSNISIHGWKGLFLTIQANNNLGKNTTRWFYSLLRNVMCSCVHF